MADSEELLWRSGRRCVGGVGEEEGGGGGGGETERWAMARRATASFHYQS